MMHSTESNLPKEKNILLYDEDKIGFAISAKRKSKTRFSEQSYINKKISYFIQSLDHLV